MAYYFAKALSVGTDTAVERVAQALKAEGFGVLTQIDVGRLSRRSSASTFETTAYWALVIQLSLTRR